MLILFIFIQLISYYIQDYVIFIDQLFKLYKTRPIYTELCPNFESSKYYYRGRPPIFTDIINETNNNKQVLNNLKNKNFKVIYVEKGYYLSSVYLFSENTVFLVNMSETINKTNPNLKNYCILRVNMNIQINGNFYYIIIGEDKNDDFLINTISSLILLYLLVFFFYL